MTEGGAKSWASYISVLLHTVDKCTHMWLINKLNTDITKVPQESQAQKLHEPGFSETS
jgi:hypothetical protein